MGCWLEILLALLDIYPESAQLQEDVGGPIRCGCLARKNHSCACCHGRVALLLCCIQGSEEATASLQQAADAAGGGEMGGRGDLQSALKELQSTKSSLDVSYDVLRDRNIRTLGNMCLACLNAVCVLTTCS